MGKMNTIDQKSHFIRVASASPELRVADVDFNVSRILTAMEIATNRSTLR